MFRNTTWQISRSGKVINEITKVIIGFERLETKGLK